MTDLQVFTYNDTAVRTIEQEDGIWWVLKDVCAILGLKNHKMVANRLDDDEKGVSQIYPLANAEKKNSQKMITVNEAGLYSVILRSDKPEAKDFKRWVTHEVLPQIRRNGIYAQNNAQAQLLTEVIKTVQALNSRLDALEAQKEAQGTRRRTLTAGIPWEKSVDKELWALSKKLHKKSGYLRAEMYKELERRTGCNTDEMRADLRRRKLEEEGDTANIYRYNKLDAIAEHEDLKKVFSEIVIEYQAK